jgi:hypothetical protein
LFFPHFLPLRPHGAEGRTALTTDPDHEAGTFVHSGWYTRLVRRCRLVTKPIANAIIPRTIHTHQFPYKTSFGNCQALILLKSDRGQARLSTGAIALG